MSTTTTPADALAELCQDFVTLIEQAIDTERREANDEHPRLVTLEGVEIYDAVPVELHRDEHFRRPGYTDPVRVWSARLERTEGETISKLSATYRLFWGS